MPSNNLTKFGPFLPPLHSNLIWFLNTKTDLKNVLSLGMAEIKQEIKSTEEAINSHKRVICYTQTGTWEINQGATWAKSHHQF